MLGRLAPQSDDERKAVDDAGLDTKRILTGDELVSSQRIFFAATGITHGLLLENVDYRGDQAQTHSLVVRGETGTLRNIRTEYHGLDALLIALSGNAR